MTMDRRTFTLSGGVLTLAFLLGGKITMLTPAQAQAHDLPLLVLSEEQATIIDLIGEAMVPGAKAAGLSRYIDHQLSVPFRDNLLILRYLRVEPPFNGFYTTALNAARQAIKQKYHKDPGRLSTKEWSEFIPMMMKGQPQGWTEAPPAPLFYFVLRSDAIDVTYGTMAGFDRLNIPYMAHIKPVQPWTVSP
ncbi:MAG: gluconate 2-dehydrogenase subunit 3 family protein [Alphaproteobacteria bacterium]|nr:gluconate 2-dehydrogenase subunit 3 family protein [Alphaproteobacteria bacterium]